MKINYLWRQGLFLTLLVVAAALTGCEQEEEHSQNAHDKPSVTITLKTFDALMQTEKFRRVMQKLPKGKNITRENARTIMEDEYNFTISDVPAKVIETDSVVSYTL